MGVTKYLIVVVLLAGCTRANQNRTFKVTGDVRLDNQPLTGGIVVFMPDKGQAAKGTIGGDGTFTLGTYAADDGAVAGQYRVAVIAPDRSAMTGGAADLERPLPSLIPARYGSTATSGLKFEVSATEPNIAHLALTSKVTP